MYRSGTFEARVHPCTLGYMRVARLLRFLLITVKLIIYKNIFKAQLVVHYSTSHLYHGFLLYMGFVPFVQFYVFPRASPSGIHKTALRVQTPCIVETHDTNITCHEIVQAISKHKYVTG